MSKLPILPSIEYAPSIPTCVPPSKPSAPSGRQILPQQLTARLRDMIVRGELRQGSRIAMQRLCGFFGVSRTPLREAFKILAAEGLVLLMPNRGAVVEKITLEKVDQLLPIVGALEILAGELACMRMDPASILKIEMLHHQLTDHFRRRDARAFVETADAIMKSIFEVADNEALTTLRAMLLRRLRWSIANAKAPSEWEKAMAEQERLLQALKLGDPGLWSMVARRHFRHRAASFRERFGQSLEVATGDRKRRSRPRAEANESRPMSHLGHVLSALSNSGSNQDPHKRIE